MEVTETLELDGTAVVTVKFNIDNNSEMLDEFQQFTAKIWFDFLQSNCEAPQEPFLSTRDYAVTHSSVPPDCLRKYFFLLLPREAWHSGPTSYSQRLLAASTHDEECRTKENILQLFALVYPNDPQVTDLKLDHVSFLLESTTTRNSDAFMKGVIMYQSEVEAFQEKQTIYEDCAKLDREQGHGSSIQRHTLMEQQNPPTPTKVVQLKPEGVAKQLQQYEPTACVELDDDHLVAGGPPRSPKTFCTGNDTKVQLDEKCLESLSDHSPPLMASMRDPLNPPVEETTSAMKNPTNKAINSKVGKEFISQTGLPLVSQRHEKGAPDQESLDNPEEEEQPIKSVVQKGNKSYGKAEAVVPRAPSKAKDIGQITKDGLIQLAQPNELSKSVQHNQPQGLTQNDPVVTSSNTECQQRSPVNSAKLLSVDKPLHALEHKYNGIDTPCIFKETCNGNLAKESLESFKSLAEHPFFGCLQHNCSVCRSMERLFEYHRNICTVQAGKCKIPHCDSNRKMSKGEITASQAGTGQQRTFLPPCSLPKPTPTKRTSGTNSSVLASYRDPNRMTLDKAVKMLSASIKWGRVYSNVVYPNKFDVGIVEKYYTTYSVMPDLLKGGEITEQPPNRSDYLGKGGNGSVHTTTLCNHTFAVKTINVYRIKELENWIKLQDPHLVPLLGAQLHFEYDRQTPAPKGQIALKAQLFAYMPIMDTDLTSIIEKSGNLVDRMKSYPDKAGTMMKNAKFILREILLGVQVLHKKYNFVHRDLKEHNILVDYRCHCEDVFLCECPSEIKYQLALTDFDSLVPIGHKIINGPKPASKHIPGTHGYRAPEAYDYVVCTDMDIWAFGAVATRLFLGREMEGVKRTIYAVLDQGPKGRQEALIPLLQLEDLLSCEGELHQAGLFIREALQVDRCARKSTEDLLRHPFLKL